MDERIKIIVQELAKKNKAVYLWFRDDDAQLLTPKLERTISYFFVNNIPLLLGVIPSELDEKAVKYIRKVPRVTVGQHGFSHINYASPDEDPSELHISRDCEVAVREQLEGKRILSEAFGNQFLNILIPPFFEISETIKLKLEKHYDAFSEWWTNDCTTTGKPCINSQVDFINWNHGEFFAGRGYVEEQILRELKLLLHNGSATVAAVGVVLHHELMDDASFLMINEILDLVKDNPNVMIKSARDVMSFVASERFVKLR